MILNGSIKFLVASQAFSRGVSGLTCGPSSKRRYQLITGILQGGAVQLYILGSLSRLDCAGLGASGRFVCCAGLAGDETVGCCVDCVDCVVGCAGCAGCCESGSVFSGCITACCPLKSESLLSNGVLAGSASDVRAPTGTIWIGAVWLSAAGRVAANKTMQAAKSSGFRHLETRFLSCRALDMALHRLRFDAEFEEKVAPQMPRFNREQPELSRIAQN